MRRRLAAALAAALCLACAAPAAGAQFTAEDGTVITVERESEATAAEIASLEEEADRLRTEAAGLEEELASMAEAMEGRIAYMYREGSGRALVDALLGSGSFAEALSRAQAVKDLYDYDAARLEEYGALAAEARGREAELEAGLSRLGELYECQKAREAGIALVEEGCLYVGTPYVWGGETPDGFDCSGLVVWCVNRCGNGWSMARVDAEGIRAGYCKEVAREDLQPGDLVFFQGTYATSGASHVGIYVGDGMMLHASGGGVRISSMETPYWTAHYMQSGRLLQACG